jgi:hypothetical protein
LASLYAQPKFSIMQMACAVWSQTSPRLHLKPGSAAGLRLRQNSGRMLRDHVRRSSRVCGCEVIDVGAPDALVLITLVRRSRVELVELDALEAGASNEVIGFPVLTCRRLLGRSEHDYDGLKGLPIEIMAQQRSLR